MIALHIVLNQSYLTCVAHVGDSLALKVLPREVMLVRHLRVPALAFNPTPDGVHGTPVAFSLSLNALSCFDYRQGAAYHVLS